MILCNWYIGSDTRRNGSALDRERNIRQSAIKDQGRMWHQTWIKFETLCQVFAAETPLTR